MYLKKYLNPYNNPMYKKFLGLFKNGKNVRRSIFDSFKSFSSKKRFNNLSSSRFEDLLDEFYIRYEVFGGPVNKLNDYEKVQTMITQLNLESVGFSN